MLKTMQNIMPKSRLRSASVIGSVFRSHTEAITHLLQIVINVIEEKKDGSTKEDKGT